MYSNTLVLWSVLLFGNSCLRVTNHLNQTSLSGRVTDSLPYLKGGIILHRFDPSELVPTDSTHLNQFPLIHQEGHCPCSFSSVFGFFLNDGSMK